MGEKLSLRKLADFNRTLMTQGDEWLKAEMRQLFPEFDDIEYDAETKTVTIYAIYQDSESGEKQYVEVVNYDYKLNKYYIRYFEGNTYKHLTDMAEHRRDEITEIIKLYMTINRILGRVV